MNKKVLSWKCRDCGKEITSIYEGQLNYNKEAHISSHKKEKNTIQGGD